MLLERRTCSGWCIPSYARSNAASWSAKVIVVLSKCLGSLAKVPGAPAAGAPAEVGLAEASDVGAAPAPQVVVSNPAGLSLP